MKGSVVEVLWGNILYGTDRGVESVVQVRLAYRGRGKERGRGERERVKVCSWGALLRMMECGKKRGQEEVRQVTREGREGVVVK